MKGKTEFNATSFLKTVPQLPGVYQMFDEKGTVIYVGKAKNLNSRLKSYFNKSEKTLKTTQLVSHIAHVEFVLTQTEVEALLLEQAYIKKFMPRYNVLLKDGKGYPYLRLTKEPYPQLSSFRGTPNKKTAEFFGPYPNGIVIKQILELMQKTFPIRQCPKSTFINRTRPCLQYQIKRCLAPCVKGYISDEDYAEQVQFVRLFLKGQTKEVIDDLKQKMQHASDQFEFEKAAQYRDQLYAISKMTEQQSIYNNNESLDAIGLHYISGVACFYLFFIRKGQPMGHQKFFPKVPLNSSLDEIVEAFLTQFYIGNHEIKPIPNKILLNYSLQDKTIIESALSEVAKHQVKLIDEPKGDNFNLLTLAVENAQTEVANYLAKKSHFQERFLALQDFLHLKQLKRMECFDISHFMGKSTIASCVVFNENGPVKEEFRRYNIKNVTAGDDYAAMRQVLMRRYQKMDLPADKIPDVIFIDGGKGQLKQALEVFSELKVNWDKNHPVLIGVAKGSDRKEGLETLFFESHGEGIYLDPHSPALLLIQQIRNASHDHAIVGQRLSQIKSITKSVLDEIEGIGAKRKQALLRHFGGLQGLKNATITEIAQVQGISQRLAQHIYEQLPR